MKKKIIISSILTIAMCVSLIAGSTFALFTSNSEVNVTIGSALHPMLEEHHIEWVYLQTNRGGQRKCLAIGSKPEVSFALCDEEPVAVFAYGNLHGRWKADV